MDEPLAHWILDFDAIYKTSFPRTRQKDEQNHHYSLTHDLEKPIRIGIVSQL